MNLLIFASSSLKEITKKSDLSCYFINSRSSSSEICKRQFFVNSSQNLYFNDYINIGASNFYINNDVKFIAPNDYKFDYKSSQKDTLLSNELSGFIVFELDYKNKIIKVKEEMEEKKDILGTYNQSKVRQKIDIYMGDYMNLYFHKVY